MDTLALRMEAIWNSLPSTVTLPRLDARLWVALALSFDSLEIDAFFTLVNCVVACLMVTLPVLLEIFCRAVEESTALLLIEPECTDVICVRGALI